MKRYLIFLVVTAMIASFSTSAFAQIDGEFGELTTVLRPYVELEDDVEIMPDEFGLPPNWDVDNLDDGYAKIQIGFPFEFNGDVFTEVYVCINGFITFGRVDANGDVFGPPNTPSRNPQGLFSSAPEQPINVIAPFWGDHIYRIDDEKYEGFQPSRISYKYDQDEGTFTVQWKDLNINAKGMLNGNYYEFRSSVADFQLTLVQSDDDISNQGNIYFSYGQIGPRNNQFQYKDKEDGDEPRPGGAAVGIKGEGTVIGQPAEFVNALYNGSYMDYDKELAKTSTELTDDWMPSGNGGYSVFFEAIVRLNEKEWWGDGDVNFSKLQGGQNFYLPQYQNLWVTVADVRVIMNAVATNNPLNEVYRREAYHADVNHNGRYYYNAAGDKVDIKWRDMKYTDSLPADVSSLKQIFFQADEYDAAIILLYLGAKVPTLPFLHDLNNIIMPWGNGKKASEDIASGLRIGQPVNINGNLYEIPVYLNDNHTGIIATRFDINGSIENVITDDEYSDMQVVFHDSRVVLAGYGNFDENQPICYVNARINDNELKFSDVRFNEEDLHNFNLNLNTEDQTNNSNILMQNVPNPFNTSTNITVNIEKEGNYKLAVYDVLGNEVYTIVNSVLTAGTYTYAWNGLDNNGNKLQKGVYVYRLISDNENYSKKLILD